jgi:hypothetical protein
VAKRLPFLKFYPRDWASDPGIRSLTIAARGLWIEMLVLMHHSPDRGYLLTPLGAEITPATLARMLSITPDECAALLAELAAAGVFSRDDRGVIYSRRMIREQGTWEKCREAGKKGGNPKLKPGGYPPGVNPEPTLGVNQLRRSEGQIPEEKKEEVRFAPLPAVAEVPAENPAKTPTTQQLIFGALAEVSGLDPATARGRIGPAAATLAKAGYTPDDVREFARRFWELCPWAQRDGRTRPTPGEVAGNIGLIRAGPGSPDVPARPPPRALPGVDRHKAVEASILTQCAEAMKAP